MKWFEQLVKKYIEFEIQDSVDPLQFSYQSFRGLQF